jgi:hypothetical protein
MLIVDHRAAAAAIRTPTPTECSIQVSRATLFRRDTTVPREFAAPGARGATLVAAEETAA